MKNNHEYDEDQDDEEITWGIQDVEEIRQTGSKKSLIGNCYKGDKEAIRDMYVPEDFQKCIKGLDTNIDESNDLHEMNKSLKTTLATTDGLPGTKDYLTSHESFKQDIHETHRFVDTTNCIVNRNKNQRMIGVEKCKNHENSFCKENENGWEGLDNFISGNKISDKSEKWCDGGVNAYTRFNPLENPSCIKRDNRNSNMKYSSGCSSKTSQYSYEQFKRNNIINSKQNGSIDFSNTLPCSSEELRRHSVDLVEPLKKQGFTESEKIYETNKERNLSNAHQKVSLQNSTSEPCQETSGLQMKAFEYNHGLPLLTSGVYSQMQELPSRKAILNPSEMFLHSVNVGHFDRINNNKCFGHAAGCRTPKRKIDLEKEFPPAEEIDRSVSFEIDRSVSFESQAKNNQLACLEKENIPAKANETSQHNRMFITDITSDAVGTESQIDGRKAFSDKPNETFSFVSAPLDTIKESDKSTGSYSSIDEADYKQFYFNPRFIESDGSNELYPFQQNRTKDLYLNPKLERISQKIYVVDDKVERNPAISVHSLEDDLRETTKKLLANNRQFSR